MALRWLPPMVLLLLAGAGHPQAPAPSASTAALLNQYCTTCHNARLKVAGLTIDPATLTDIAPHAEVWEKVLAKLHTGDMPPVNSPRPSAQAYASAASFLESSLDRASVTALNPGALPLVHRLTRTEYRNTIRDLLLLDRLPKEMDYEMLLPPDNASSGFDNIADLLFVSPAIMERYLEAARKISRLAVGDPTMPVMVNFHRMSAEMPQDGRAEDLPMGTRGGLAIHTYIPLDAEYTIAVSVSGGQEGHQLELSVDGQRVETYTFAAARGRGGRGGGGAPPTFRVPLKAGPRDIGVTFVQRSEVFDEALVRPKLRGAGSQPAVTEVNLSGPYNATGPGVTPTRQRLFVCRTQDDVCAHQILLTLARRAYRRPVYPRDIEPLLPFYEAGKKEAGFERGIQKALERLLVSPQFLFRIEREPAGTKPGELYRVNDLELASRLSYFLWSSMPDDQLLTLAESGQLSEARVLREQTARLLRDPRSQAMVTNFAAQWLQLRTIETAAPDILKFRDYDQTLVRAFQQETELFLNSILREPRPILDLLTANYTFVNDRLAEHYGIPNIKGSHFRRVTLPPQSNRGGLLGLGGILTLTSYPTRTSPVLRGKYVLENLLGAPPPPPPPDVPALKTEGARADEELPMREAMTLHRAAPACASCHARMDPIGFALENFDAIGQWRDKDGGKPIDVASALPDGTPIVGVDGIKQYILARPERFVSATTEKLLMYAIGRNVQYFDQPAVRGIVRGAARDNYTFESLVQGVVASAPFQLRKVQEAP